jgi:hypothetical protein
LAKSESGNEPEVPERLVRQIGDILYTVRNNLFHGCKGPDDSNDEEVLLHALELLRTVMDFYAGREDNPQS